jgi:hypothetical protein
MKTIKIYQIETTSKCSATCSFCPHPTMERTKEHISLDLFKRVIDVMANDYCALHHFGEPLLHPELPEMIAYAKSKGKRVEFSTNGKGLNAQKDGDAYLRRVLAAEPHRMRIAYDYFQPDEFVKKALTLNVSTIITMHAVTKGVLLDFKPLNNWAGQMASLGESEIKGSCHFLKYGYNVVMASGHVVPCCQDYEGKHVIGHIDDLDSLKPQPTYDLCKTCSGMQFAKDGGWREE